MLWPGSISPALKSSILPSSVRTGWLIGREDGLSVDSIASAVTDYILGLENRTTITLDGLTPSQEDDLLKVIDIFLKQFKA